VHRTRIAFDVSLPVSHDLASAVSWAFTVASYEGLFSLLQATVESEQVGGDQGGCAPLDLQRGGPPSDKLTLHEARGPILMAVISITLALVVHVCAVEAKRFSAVRKLGRSIVGAAGGLKRTATQHEIPISQQIVRCVCRTDTGSKEAAHKERSECTR